MSNVITFPQRQREPNCRVIVFTEPDGTAVVRISPCPAGVAPRTVFRTYDEAWNFAKRLAAVHALLSLPDGSTSSSVTISGPEASA